ncbi:MAG: amidohydrolase family protein [Bacteroidetes bacterium]|nr:amidohydrolase family protein [Rhodothermia bacterium]MCS7154964.1 amidohydrolase family protein [Bacteroidota bacterium]MCX7907248.1 amidohydrolase family protein [Bacteroidota bacterium]MDW8138026.1 amidohydrolase family protein [Bacteroidota bacterium]MDW8286122.1 amidohydrolase family protein [Bacteroidota bacterium]
MRATTLWYAPWVFPGDRAPIREGAVLLDSEGRVLAVGPYRALRSRFSGASVCPVEGALAPGFVNAHVHLELSHLRGRIPAGLGLAGFIRSLQAQRDGAASEVRRAAIEEAIRALQAEGVVAVGDIGNGVEAWGPACALGMRGVFFLERFGWDPERAQEIFRKARQQLRAGCLRGDPGRRYALTPHALYSTSELLIRRILAENARLGLPCSLHMLESEAERELFTSGGGSLAELLRALGADLSGWRPPRESPLLWLLRWVHPRQRLLLVHMTVAQPEELDLLRRFPRVAVVLCPRSNRYIEGRMPPLTALLDRGVGVAVGTDSLASNSRLSVWAELQELGQAFTELTLEQAIRLASWNGARALGLGRILGALRVGRRPGLVALEGDLKHWREPGAVQARALHLGTNS